MKELVRGLVLFLLNWLLVIIFYYLLVLVFVGDLLQSILRTSKTPDASIFIDIFLIIVISYFVNSKFIRARRITFLITQGLFVMSAVALYLMALQAVADGIMGA